MNKAAIIVTWACLIPVLVLLAGFAAMLAWNMAMPHLFGLPKASLASGVGLVLLAMILKPAFSIGAK